jgi:ankyrin repeat protein
VGALVEAGPVLPFAPRWLVALLAATVIVTACEPSLESAVYSGNAESVQEFLDHGADVNKGGGTLLRLAVEGGQGDVVKLLLEKGANVNATNVDGGTPLMMAATYGHADIVKLLLPKVTNVNAVDVQKETALYKSVVEKHIDVVRLLLAAGADPAVGDVMSLAAHGGRADIAKVLRAPRSGHTEPPTTEARADAAP